MIEVYYSKEFYKETLLYRKDELFKWSDGYTSSSKYENKFWPQNTLNINEYKKLFEITE